MCKYVFWLPCLPLPVAELCQEEKPAVRICVVPKMELALVSPTPINLVKRRQALGINTYTWTLKIKASIQTHNEIWKKNIFYI